MTILKKCLKLLDIVISNAVYALLTIVAVSFWLGHIVVVRITDMTYLIHIN